MRFIKISSIHAAGITDAFELGMKYSIEGLGGISTSNVDSIQRCNKIEVYVKLKNFVKKALENVDSIDNDNERAYFDQDIEILRILANLKFVVILPYRNGRSDAL